MSWKYAPIALFLIAVVAFYAWVFWKVKRDKVFENQLVTEAIKVLFVFSAGVGVALLANLFIPEMILRYQTQFEINKDALDRGNNLTQQTLTSIYTPFYNMIMVRSDISRGDSQDLPISWNRYRDSLVKWNVERDGIVSQITILFGYSLADEIQTTLSESSVDNPVSIQDQITDADYHLRTLKSCYENNCSDFHADYEKMESSIDSLYKHIDSFETKLTQAVAKKEESIRDNPFGIENSTQ